MFARNFGYLNNDMFNIFVSWASLLIIFGIYLICKKSYLWGSIVSAVGLFHTLDKLPQVPFGMNEMLWPTILVIGGIYLLFRPNRFSRRHHHFKGPFNKNIDNRDFKYFKSSDIASKLSLLFITINTFSCVIWNTSFLFNWDYFYFFNFNI